MNEIKNGLIEKTYLGLINDMFTMQIIVRYNKHQEQMYGMFIIDSPEYITKLLEVLGVISWNELEGTPVRVEATDEEIYKIGNFIEDKWYDYKEIIKDSEDNESGRDKGTD